VQGPTQGTIIQQRYQLSTELGQGGMGIVYQANDLLLERIVAVKVLSKTASTEDRRQLLLAEAKAAAKLNHPNVVSVYDAGEVSGVPYIVLEYIEGQTLRDLGQPSAEEVMTIAKDVCAALNHAHQNGIIHRDLKPENVMITDDDQVKLMDFGLARLSDRPRLTIDNALAGTINYLAPELIIGKPATELSDLYALGVMLYELTAGRPPFDGDNLAVVLSNHLHAPVTPPSAHHPSISSFLDALVLQLLEKDPENRPQSASEVLDQLTLISDPTFAAMPVASESPITSLLDRIAGGRLIGRDDELAQSTALWLRALSGQAGLLLISGEPGIGKTRLAQAIIAQARIGGSAVLNGGCYEFEATTPYLPFSEAIREWVRGQDQDSLRHDLGETAAELVRLAPEIEGKLGPQAPNPDLGLEEQRLRLFDNIAQFFERLAGDRGLLIFVDDLHWADKGTLSLLTYLMRRLRSAQLLVVAAYREVELDRRHPLADALVDWNRQRVAVRIPLTRFSHDQTKTMIATLFRDQSVSDEFTEVIHRETDGNPFFIEEVVKALVEQGQIYWTEDHWEREELDQLAIPQSIKEAIGRRLSGLSQSCVETLHIAAVIGKDFAFSLLQSVSGESEELLLDILDEASNAQLIRQQGAESFVFTHDKIREVLYDEILTVRRSRLHLKTARSLEAFESDQQVIQVEEIAYHYIAAGELDKGMDYALQAAAKAQQLFAGDEAIEYLRQALECAVSLEDLASQAMVLENLGDTHSLIGPFNAAVDYYQQAARLTTGRKVAINVKIGMVLSTTNDEKGIPILEDALSELEPQNNPELVARGLSSLGRFHHYRCEYSVAIELFEQARELAEPIGDVFSLSLIYAYLAGAYQHLADFDQSLAWAQRDIKLGERNNFLSAIAVGYEFIAEDNLIMGYWDRALEAARYELQIAEKIGAAARKAWSRWVIGSALYGKGKLVEAVAELEQAVDFAVTIGENRLALLCYTALSSTYADMGNELAIDFSNQAIEGATKMVELFQLGYALQIKGYVYLQLGEPENALEAFEASQKLLENTESIDVALYRLPYQAEALLQLGESEAAFNVLSKSLELTQGAGAPHHEAVAHRVSGLFYLEKGNMVEASKSLERAIDIARELGSRVELGRSNYAMAMAYLGDDDLETARTYASKAKTLFTESSASRELAKTMKLIEQLDG